MAKNFFLIWEPYATWDVSVLGNQRHAQKVNHPALTHE